LVHPFGWEDPQNCSGLTGSYAPRRGCAASRCHSSSARQRRRGPLRTTPSSITARLPIGHGNVCWPMFVSQAHADELHRSIPGPLSD
jgi:hypothetical protein